MKTHNEHPSEAVVESHLLANGYVAVSPDDDDRERAIFPAQVLAFNAIHQCRFDRDPREKPFEFKKRSLVHFAVDTEPVFMTTGLAGCRFEAWSRRLEPPRRSRAWWSSSG